MVREDLFASWHSGNPKAFEICATDIWVQNYAIVLTLMLYGYNWEEADQSASEGFWWMMEEVDQGVSGGKFTIENGIGRYSGRALKAKPLIEWRGEVEFNALVRLRWIQRARDVRRQQEVLLPLPYDAPDPICNTAIEGCATPSILISIVSGLSRLKEEEKDDSTRQKILHGTIKYIKYRIACCNPLCTDVSLEQTYNTNVRTLLEQAELNNFDMDSRDWHQFLLDNVFPSPPPDDDTKRRNRSKLDQSIKRLKPDIWSVIRQSTGREKSDVP